AFLELHHLGLENAIALQQSFVLALLLGNLPLQIADLGKTAVTDPQAILQSAQNQDQHGEQPVGSLDHEKAILLGQGAQDADKAQRFYERGRLAPPSFNTSSLSRGTRHDPCRAPCRRAALRCAAAGCTWRRGRSGTASRS